MNKEKRGIPLVLLIFILLVIIGIIILISVNIAKKETTKDEEINKEIINNNQVEQIENSDLRIVEDVIIPEEFYYIGGTKKEGIVISSIKDDDMDNNKKGNQFVWVPVENFEEFVRYDFGKQNIADSKFINTKPNGNESYYEPTPENTSGCTKETEQEVKLMYASVEKYKGFYIARFEAGKENINGEDQLVSKKNVQVWNKINYGKSITDDKGGAIELARKMYSEVNNENEIDNKYYVRSTLCYGVQWDAIMRWVNEDEELKAYLTNAEANGNSESANQQISETMKEPNLTGTEYNKIIKNIYDLCGNCEELTMEIYRNNSHVSRGGSYVGTPNTLASRQINNLASDKNNEVSFRVTMYISEQNV